MEILKVLEGVSGGEGESGGVQSFYLIGAEGGKELKELGSDEKEKVFKTNGNKDELISALGICVGGGKQSCVDSNGIDLRLISAAGWEEVLKEDNLKGKFSGFLVGNTTESNGNAKTASEKVNLNDIGDENVRKLFDGVKWSPHVETILNGDGEFVKVLKEIKKGFERKRNCEHIKGKSFYDWLRNIGKSGNGHTCNVSLYNILNENADALKRFFSEKENGLKLLLSLMTLWSLARDNVQSHHINEAIKKINKFNKFLTVNDNKISSNFVGLSSSNEGKDDELKVWADVKVSSITLKSGRGDREVNLTFSNGNVDVKIGELGIKFSMGKLGSPEEIGLTKEFRIGTGQTVTNPLFNVFSRENKEKNLFNLIYLLALLVSDKSKREVNVNFDIELKDKDPVATINKAS